MNTHRIIEAARPHEHPHGLAALIVLCTFRLESPREPRRAWLRLFSLLPWSISHNFIVTLLIYFPCSFAILSEVDSIGPSPLPDCVGPALPPPDAGKPSSASPFSGAGGAAALLLRSTPEAAGACSHYQVSGLRQSALTEKYLRHCRQQRRREPGCYQPRRHCRPRIEG